MGEKRTTKRNYTGKQKEVAIIKTDWRKGQKT